MATIHKNGIFAQKPTACDKSPKSFKKPKKYLKLALFAKNEPLGSPTRLLSGFESRHTALFVIFALRGSGEPTGAFRLKFSTKFASKMPKMAILTPLFSIFEQILPKIVNFWPFLADLNAPYYLLRGGFLDNSLLDAAGSGGSYWSSNPSGSSYAYTLDLSSGRVYTNFYYRYYGFSVRCVAAG